MISQDDIDDYSDLLLTSFDHGYEPTDEETFEEHTARMKKISDEIKADMSAGRYKNGQIHPNIYGEYKHFENGHNKENPYDSIFRDSIAHIYKRISDQSESKSRMFIFDSFFTLPSKREMSESHYISPEAVWVPKSKEKDWERKTFVSGGPTTPSEETRLKRRAERNRKRKEKEANYRYG